MSEIKTNSSEAGFRTFYLVFRYRKILTGLFVLALLEFNLKLNLSTAMD